MKYFGLLLALPASFGQYCPVACTWDQICLSDGLNDACYTNLCKQVPSPCTEKDFCIQSANSVECVYDPCYLYNGDCAPSERCDRTGYNATTNSFENRTCTFEPCRFNYVTFASGPCSKSEICLSGENQTESCVPDPCPYNQDGTRGSCGEGFSCSPDTDGSAICSVAPCYPYLDGTYGDCPLGERCDLEYNMTSTQFEEVCTPDPCANVDCPQGEGYCKILEDNSARCVFYPCQWDRVTGLQGSCLSMDDVCQSTYNGLTYQYDETCHPDKCSPSPCAKGEACIQDGDNYACVASPCHYNEDDTYGFCSPGERCEVQQDQSELCFPDLCADPATNPCKANEYCSSTYQSTTCQFIPCYAGQGGCLSTQACIPTADYQSETCVPDPCPASCDETTTTCQATVLPDNTVVAVCREYPSIPTCIRPCVADCGKLAGSTQDSVCDCVGACDTTLCTPEVTTYISEAISGSCTSIRDDPATCIANCPLACTENDCACLALCPLDNCTQWEAARLEYFFDNNCQEVNGPPPCIETCYGGCSAGAGDSVDCDCLSLCDTSTCSVAAKNLIEIYTASDCIDPDDPNAPPTTERTKEPTVSDTTSTATPPTTERTKEPTVSDITSTATLLVPTLALGVMALA